MSGLIGSKKPMQNFKTIKITVVGRVQGVGFRPFVFALAEKFCINGTVQNNMDGVKIFAEGTVENINVFISELKNNPPRLARIDRVMVEDEIYRNYSSFMIVESDRSGKSSLVIPIDSAVCEDCNKEMNDPKDFRYQYPFINCTQCGPRYTIIKELPYDRPYTTMNEFTMCDDCKREFEDPSNRRHHAQPIACPKCGPKIQLIAINGNILYEGQKAIEATQAKLLEGKVVAIKGLGGYHLACNAFDEETVLKLRKRKNRPNRPLAVMGIDLEAVEKIVFINNEERKLLNSPESPIVVARKKQSSHALAISIAPGMNTVGVFLPYTPLHKLLFKNNIEFLVMTSANPSGLPMLYKDSEAFTYLEGIADYILVSDREIEHPIDDSVVQVVDGNTHFFRRARGFVPDPIFLNKSVNGIIGLGPQQKNTFAIGRGEQIFIGPHIGDMGSVEVTDHYLNEYRHLMKWMDVEPVALAIDMHPQYETTRLASELDCTKVIKVQHHHAHHVSCMVDNKLEEACLGLILDGTGYGEDGNIWGFELLYGNASFYERLGHLAYHPLPGGEKAVKEPWRNAVGMIISEFGLEEGSKLAKNIFDLRKKEVEIIATMLDKKINSPLAGTCGRLFDAVSAIAGVCEESTYDGEAAICLSELVSEKEQTNDFYSFSIIENEGIGKLIIKELIQEVIEDVLNNTEQKQISLKFHQTVVEMCLELISQARGQRQFSNNKVVLSGGSFHNRYLLHHLKIRLEKLGFEVYNHNQFPCNDGGVSLGQLMIAKEQL